MPVFAVTTGYHDLGTLASGSCIFSLSNPAGSGKNIRLRRLTARCGFVGTAAATKLDFGVCRATGAAAAGTGSKATTGIAVRNGGSSIATMRYGPAAITGLTPDAAGDFRTAHLGHQVGPVQEFDLLEKDPENRVNWDPVVISPGTTLAVFTRSISVAGSGLEIDADWYES